MGQAAAPPESVLVGSSPRSKRVEARLSNSWTGRLLASACSERDKIGPSWHRGCVSKGAKELLANVTKSNPHLSGLRSRTVMAESWLEETDPSQQLAEDSDTCENKMQATRIMRQTDARCMRNWTSRRKTQHVFRQRLAGENEQMPGTQPVSGTQDAKHSYGHGSKRKKSNIEVTREDATPKSPDRLSKSRSTQQRGTRGHHANKDAEAKSKGKEFELAVENHFVMSKLRPVAARLFCHGWRRTAEVGWVVCGVSGLKVSGLKESAYACLFPKVRCLRRSRR